MTPKRILVVDDEPSISQTISVVLKLDGPQIEIAPDAQNALAMFDASPHDLVIVDYMLPGMNGLQLARALRARRPQQPILLVTGNLELIGRSKGTLEHVNNVLEKPFGVQDLRAAVAALLPLFLPLSVALAFLEPAFRSGGSIEVYAFKE